MKVEIERKWLVVGEPPIDRALRATRISQGYLDGVAGTEVRVRVCRPVTDGAIPIAIEDAVSDEWAELQIKRKHPHVAGEAQESDESPPFRIGLDVGGALMSACPWRLEKTRYLLPVRYWSTYGDDAPHGVTPAEASRLRWELDVFDRTVGGQRLRVVELELPRRDFPLPPLPPWVGAEVTGEALYNNRALARQRGGVAARGAAALTPISLDAAGAAWHRRPMQIPVRPTLTPTLAERDADERAWRAFAAAVKRAAKRCGMVVNLRVSAGGYYSWCVVSLTMTRVAPDGAELADKTRVEVVPIADERDVDHTLVGVPQDAPAARPSGCVVRQIDRVTGHRGPNHAPGGVRTELDVVTLAMLLSARPFDRDRCSHCTRAPSAATPTDSSDPT